MRAPSANSRKHIATCRIPCPALLFTLRPLLIYKYIFAIDSIDSAHRPNRLLVLRRWLVCPTGNICSTAAGFHVRQAEDITRHTDPAACYLQFVWLILFLLLLLLLQWGLRSEHACRGNCWIGVCRCVTAIAINRFNFVASKPQMSCVWSECAVRGCRLCNSSGLEIIDPKINWYAKAFIRSTTKTTYSTCCNARTSTGAIQCGVHFCLQYTGVG